MLKFATHGHSYKGNVVPNKVFFLLICLHVDLIDYIRKKVLLEKNCFSFIVLSEHVFNFLNSNIYLEKHYIYLPVLSMDRDLKAQLCL